MKVPKDSPDRLVDLNQLTKVRESDGAFLLTDDPRKPDAAKWVPKSLCEDNGDGTFTMPTWKARELGWV